MPSSNASETGNVFRLDRLPASPGQLARERAQSEEIELLSELIIRANQSPEMLRRTDIDRVFDPPGDACSA